MALTGSPYIEVPCGKCIACRIQRTNEWVTRIMHEFETFKKIGCFITLTSKDEELKYGKIFNNNCNNIYGFNLYNNSDSNSIQYATLNKADLQKFFKRLRKNLESLLLCVLCPFAPLRENLSINCAEGAGGIEGILCYFSCPFLPK